MTQRARARGSQVDRYARLIAADMANRRTPSIAADLDAYIDRCPDDVMVALDGFAAHAAHEGPENPLSVAHLVLIERFLERIRYRSERGYEDALGLLEAFQAAATALAAAERIDTTALGMITAALHRAGIVASEELRQAVVARAPDDLPDDLASHLPSPDAVLGEIATLCDGDPFLFVEILLQTGNGMPAGIRAKMAAEQARSGNPPLGEAAVLLLLDPEPAVRKAVAEVLPSRAGAISPVSLRRMIAIRTWLPEPERKAIDEIIRAARSKGIECAQWPDREADALFASSIDGSGAQALLAVTPAGKRQRLSSILCKREIRDTYVGDPETRNKIQSTLAASTEETCMMQVPRAYFDRVVRHNLHAGQAHGILPPVGLLHVAETLGGVEWQPEACDWRTALAEMVAELPREAQTPTAIGELLAQSDEWADLAGVGESWFEDDPDVVGLVRKNRRGPTAKIVEYVLRTVLARRREKWAELFTRTALWLRAAPNATMPWQNFALLARELVGERDIDGISLMHVIAAQTVVNVLESEA